jgi:hypothetical protein
MKKDVDNRPPLGYDVPTIDDQTAIEEKYEMLFDEEVTEEAMNRFLDKLLGPEKKS